MLKKGITGIIPKALRGWRNDFGKRLQIAKLARATKYRIMVKTTKALALQESYGKPGVGKRKIKSKEAASVFYLITILILSTFPIALNLIF